MSEIKPKAHEHGVSFVNDDSASDRVPSRSVVIFIDRDIETCCRRMGYLNVTVCT
jgi:hypothetical protein